MGPGVAVITGYTVWANNGGVVSQQWRRGEPTMAAWWANYGGVAITQIWNRSKTQEAEDVQEMFRQDISKSKAGK